MSRSGIKPIDPRWNVLDGYDEGTPMILPREDFLALRRAAARARVAELESFVLGFALGFLVTRVATWLGFGRRATKRGHQK